MRAFWIFIILLAFSIGWFGDQVSPASNVYGLNDISWPNCGLPIAQGPAGIVGITGGLANHPNPCLKYQAGRYRIVSAYVNTGYPGAKRALKFQNFPKRCAKSDDKCLAYNYGYNSGLYDIRQSLKNGVVAKKWWLDVETENSWDPNPMVNREALRGNVDSLSNFIGRSNIGFYSYPGQWKLITASWHNGFPDWIATGSLRLVDAVNACKESFTGGKTIYGQYTDGLDVDYICH